MLLFRPSEDYHFRDTQKFRETLKDSNLNNTRALDSNYSENGTWLDSKFTLNKMRETKPRYQENRSKNESNSKKIPSTFSTASSGKKINDYILMGKVKNISFPESVRRKSDRYYNETNKNKLIEGDEVLHPPMVKFLLDKAKFVNKQHRYQAKESDEEDSLYLDPQTNQTTHTKSPSFSTYDNNVKE